MRRLELLAPARNADIGIAAIDCGADAVYIAAPKFGARQAAGNGISDIARLCSYAHRFGARIFVTLNTIIYGSELQEAEETLLAVQEAGADAVIVQDMAFAEMLCGSTAKGTGNLHGMPLHASTQCAIRTPEKAKFLEKAGFSRLILERELSLEQIKAICGSVDCEIEFFVHGALCVCYSGQCYLSEHISGRSANRGACIQACRSRYDLADSKGNVLAKNKSLLSLKDYSLKDRLGDLAMAGVTSFKIEGRLKNISYVRNTVRDYAMALDRFIAKPENAGMFSRASFGRVTEGFIPDTGKVFNRGCTELFLDGRKGQWASMDAAKSMGEALGTVSGLNKTHTGFTILPDKIRTGRRSHNAGRTLEISKTSEIGKTPAINNGDGLSFVSRSGEVTGVRADVCHGLSVTCKATPELYEGARIFRNFNIGFEKYVESNPCRRLIDAEINIIQNRNESKDGKIPPIEVRAISHDGRDAAVHIKDDTAAENQDRMKSLFTAQLSKTSGIYSFHVGEIPDGTIFPLMPASAINAIRRTISEMLDEMPCNSVPLYRSGYLSCVPEHNASTGNDVCTENDVREKHNASEKYDAVPGRDSDTDNPGDRLENGITLDYKANVANKAAEAFYSRFGLKVKEKAYELTHRGNAELMRSRYCIRHELGLCPVHQRGNDSGPLFLINNGRRLTLGFDCRNCEMTVSE